ncbi:uncharacterized protein BXIN_0882 [Babesia sp. Xinjiang]|uniref:uncharacterized protein n=1 Tax=Babesia sp. Xinjiang TaxID=462227 RepID=UPI000A22DCEC|nr:uncharacterized protein BXIN_0882 [Babesia sp. Xinjiang]ORM41219.1 hypothetical protein BXIN_0882 [Babesia sp. Xinjiang]
MDPDDLYGKMASSTSMQDTCRKPFEPPSRSDIHEEAMKDGQSLIDVATDYLGTLETMEIPAYGTISAEHNDILEMTADAILVPVPPNLTPYGGLGLNVLERGGKKLITALVKRAKVVIAERLKALEAMQSHFNSSEEYKDAVKHAKSLEIGDVILTPTFGATKTTVIGFVVAPFFLEINSREAALKIRHMFKSSLEYLNRMSIRTVLCPYLADSVNGYEPKKAIHAMIEEAYDVLTELDSIKPLYAIQNVRLVHKRLSEARKIASAIVDVAHERRPELQVQPASVYYSRASQRLIEFDESVLKFCSQQRKITYKRHSVVRKSNRMHWLRNVKPYVWRTGRLYSPPPLLVYKATGLPTLKQLPPRPYYKDRLSHVLFPLMRKPIKGLRTSGSGHLLGKTKPDPIYMQRKEL